MYMESIGNARSFLSAAREVSLSKPIIVIKAGRTAAAAKAAASHTGSLAGSDEVLDAAFRRCGVLRVERISELFNMAEVLAKQPQPKGPNLTILTNAGGPGVLATDALIEGGGKLTKISNDTLERLNAELPVHWSHNNPIDILGDAGPQRYASTLAIAAEDPNSDGLLVVLTPQDMTHPTQTAEQLVDLCKTPQKKPILTSWMGGPRVAAGENVLNRANIPTFEYPDMAARIFNYMWQYAYNLKTIYETPSLPVGGEEGDVAQQQATDLIEKIRSSGRTILTEFESKQIFNAYGIPTVETRLARTPEAAIQCADEIGYPVVLKLNSETITHKSDVGGVQLNLRDEAAVLRAFETIRITVSERVGEENFHGVTVQPMVKLDGYELIVGSSQDAQFGPVLLFGTGGTLVEVFRDRALALPPLNTTLARRMMEQTKIYTALQGVRGQQSVDMEALESLLVRFSHLVVEQPWINEIDINPLLAGPDGIVALDARIVLQELDVEAKDLTPLAIRAYPTQYVKPWEMANGTKICMRPIRPEDEPLMGAFNRSISPHSIYLRYFHPISSTQLTSHEQLASMCFIDFDREITLVAERKNEQGKPEILAMGQLSKLHGTNDAEFALLVSDDYQRTGLGTEMLSRLLDIGRDEGLENVVAEILPENEGMRRVCSKLDFHFERKPGTGVINASIAL